MNSKLDLGGHSTPPPPPSWFLHYAFSEQKRDVLMMESMLNSVKSANYTLAHDARVLVSFWVFFPLVL